MHIKSMNIEYIDNEFQLKSYLDIYLPMKIYRKN